MKRILIVADQMNWCFSHRALALQKYAPDNWEVDIVYYSQDELSNYTFALYDLVFCLPTNLVGPLRLLFDRAQLDIPLVASHNSGVGRRHQVLLQTLLAADYTIVNNYGAWNNLRMFCLPERYFCCNISNGIDCDVFRNEVPIEERPHRVVWSASLPKIEESNVKGFADVIQPLSILLPNAGFEADFRVVDPGHGLNAEQMREWYNSASYVICASTSEGTPNIMLEGMACGCVGVSSQVGNMPEIIRDKKNGVLASRSTGGIFTGLKFAREKRKELSDAMRRDIKRWDWRYRSKWFYALFEKVIQGERPAPFTYLDTSPEQL